MTGRTHFAQGALGHHAYSPTSVAVDILKAAHQDVRVKYETVIEWILEALGSLGPEVVIPIARRHSFKGGKQKNQEFLNKNTPECNIREALFETLFLACRPCERKR